jgi:hypothetical protein
MDFFPRLCQKSWFVMKKTLSLIALFARAAWTMAAAPDSRTFSRAGRLSGVRAAASSATFPTQVDVVTVDVVVTDKKGRPSRASPRATSRHRRRRSPDDHRLRGRAAAGRGSEKPAPRPRVSSNLDRESHAGRSFVILFDDIHLTLPGGQRAKAAVAQFLKTGVREGDRVSLVATGGGAWWSTRMEAGRDELIALLKRLDGRFIPDSTPERMSDYEAMRIHIYHDQQVEERVSRPLRDLRGQRALAVLAGREPLPERRSLRAGARERRLLPVRVPQPHHPRDPGARADLPGAAKGRKSVILVSEGFIYDPNLYEFKDAVQASRRGNAAMYFLDARGLTGMPSYFTAEFGPPIDTRDIGRRLPGQPAGGGRGGVAGLGQRRVLRQELERPRPRHPAHRGREPQLLPPRLQLLERLARRPLPQDLGQAAGQEGPHHPRAQGILRGPGRQGEVPRKPETADPAIQAALDSPYQEQGVPIRTTSYVFDETLLGKASALVAADIDISKFAYQEKDGRFQDTLDFLIVVAHRETGEFFRYDQKIEMNLMPATKARLAASWYPIVRDFELAPGGYQAKIVRARQEQRQDRDRHPRVRGGRPVPVPDLDPRHHRHPAAGPGEEGRAAAGHHREAHLRAGATLFASFEVYGATKEKPTGCPRSRRGTWCGGRTGRRSSRSRPRASTRRPWASSPASWARACPPTPPERWSSC